MRLVWDRDTVQETFRPVGAPALKITERLSTRATRDVERGRQAARRVHEQGGSAVDAALAQIDATFNDAAVINQFKQRVAGYLRRGIDDPAVIARYSGRAALLAGYSLNAACAVIDSWYQNERTVNRIACALGSGNNLSLEILRELRLILRFMRYRRSLVS